MAISTLELLRPLWKFNQPHKSPLLTLEIDKKIPPCLITTDEQMQRKTRELIKPSLETPHRGIFEKANCFTFVQFPNEVDILISNVFFFFSLQRLIYISNL